jgi:glycosyltransferase involved in cell wall biosynthesis
MFLGRLEVRKGVLELARAIPIILDQAPHTVFRFVGRSLPHPGTNEDLKAVLDRELGASARAVEFIDEIPYDRVAMAFADTDILVFPSAWENFPNVCLEAMAAARGVVGSSAGGMAEIIEDGQTGLLVPPRTPKAIAAAVIRLLEDPERRIAMGRAARTHVATAYSPEVIAPLQEASYRRAIAVHRKVA